MGGQASHARRRIHFGAGLFAAALIAGCSPEAIIGGTAGATVVGANSPSHEIQQIYYLGAFDPQGQLPPTVYRIRVHGQTSSISFAKFASGWVPAQFIDSLSASAGFKTEAGVGVEIDQGASETLSKLKTGRRLMLFGPEGFREAPRDHRLVVVMGSNPEGFFNAIDTSLGIIAEARAGQRSDQLDRELFDALTALQKERSGLTTLKDDTQNQLSQAAGN